LTSVSPALHLTAAWCFTVAGLVVAAGVAAGGGSESHGAGHTKGKNGEGRANVHKNLLSV